MTVIPINSYVWAFGLLALQKDVNLKIKGQSESQQAFIGDKKK